MDALYQITVYPIQLFIEIVYVTLYHAFEHFSGRSGFAILGVSLVVSFLTHPLYMKAEALQDLQREVLKRMEKRLAVIRRNFSGDKKYMLVDACYRKNGYHPLMALRSSLSLVIMIPFFMAAYVFLSQPGLLEGESFLCFSDLSRQDALVDLFGFRLNVLPILMTVVNLAASFVYAEKLTKGERAQLYVTALVFLVLLYGSPAGLVLYWTFNNLFSLGKNVWLRYKWRMPGSASLRGFFDAHAPIYPLSPFLVDSLFVYVCIAMWLLAGVVLPFNLAASSPLEFCGLCGGDIKGLLYCPAVQAFGIFVFWCPLVYFISDRKVRNVLVAGACSILCMSIVNIFRHNSESVAQGLRMIPLEMTESIIVSYVFVLVAFAALFAVFCLFMRAGHVRSLISICVIFSVACLISSVFNYSSINRASERYREIQASERRPSDGEPAITLSKKGRNVVLVFLDKAVSSFFPVALGLNPGIGKSLSGFVYYPDTVSFATHTILSVPSMFGGYEYTPYAMDSDSSKKMKEKHNEALLCLPMIFNSAGGSSSVSDMPLKNYEWFSDNRMFEEKGIRGLNFSGTMTKRYLEEELGFDLPQFKPENLLRHDLLIYSFMKMAPDSVNRRLFNRGKYLNSIYISLKQKLPGENMAFLDAYAVMKYMPSMTEVVDDSSLRLNVFCSDLTHEPVYLQFPEYKPAGSVTEKGPDFFGSDEAFRHYHVNVAALMLLCDWCDSLKRKGVYDNTRIIVVSDHGAPIRTPACRFEGAVYHNPLLLVKDFNSKGEVRTDGTFMTLADVPCLVCRGVIDDPVNPFTGRRIGPADKAGGVRILFSDRQNPQDFKDSKCVYGGDHFMIVGPNVLDVTKWRPDSGGR